MQTCNMEFQRYTFHNDGKQKRARQIKMPKGMFFKIHPFWKQMQFFLLILISNIEAPVETSKTILLDTVEEFLNDMTVRYAQEAQI